MSSTFSNADSKALADLGAIELRTLDLGKLLGGGIIHTKMWIVDDKHFYIGSANMDWRSLAQVSTGIIIPVQDVIFSFFY